MLITIDVQADIPGPKGAEENPGPRPCPLARPRAKEAERPTGLRTDHLPFFLKDLAAFLMASTAAFGPFQRMILSFSVLKLVRRFERFLKLLLDREITHVLQGPAPNANPWAR